jgi:hypothetical protein
MNDLSPPSFALCVKRDALRRANYARAQEYLECSCDSPGIWPYAQKKVWRIARTAGIDLTVGRAAKGNPAFSPAECERMCAAFQANPHAGPVAALLTAEFGRPVTRWAVAYQARKPATAYPPAGGLYHTKARLLILRSSGEGLADQPAFLRISRVVQRPAPTISDKVRSESIRLFSRNGCRLLQP